MTEKHVDILVTANDDDAKAKLDALKAKLDMLQKGAEVKLGVDNTGANTSIDNTSRKLSDFGKSKASATLAVNSDKATAALDRLSLKMDKLSTTAAQMKVGLQDKDALLGLDRVQLRLETLNEKTANPKITVEGVSRAISEVMALDAAMKRLDKAGTTFNESQFRQELDKSIRTELSASRALSSGQRAIDNASKLRGELSQFMFEGSGGKGSFPGTGGSGGGGGFFRRLLGYGFSGAQGLTGGGVVGGLGAGALGVLGGIIPSLVGVLSGVGIGGLGAFGAYKLGSNASTAITTLQSQIASARGKQRQALERQLAQERQQYAPMLKFYNRSQTAVGNADQSFFSALTSHGTKMVNANTFAGGANGAKYVSGDTFKQVQTPSFLQGLDGIMKQIDKFLKSIGPELGTMLRASLPILNMFIKSLETFAKLMMPAFTSLMSALKPDLPIIQQGFKYLSEGLAGFIRNLGGPGMKDSAIIFKGVMDVIGHILSGSAIAFNGLAIMLVDSIEAFKRWGHKIASMYDDFRHRTAVVFDGARHEVAHIWDIMWNDVIGKTIHFIEQIHTDVANWRHDVANTFDGLRHDIASIWNRMWDDSIGKVVHFIEQFHTDVANWRHDTANTFDSVRHDVAATWDRLWSDITSATSRGAEAVVNWFKRMGTDIWNDLRHLPGILWNLAKMMVTNLWKGAQSEANKVYSFFKGVGHGIMSALHSVFHFGSPSKTMYKYGQWITEGLAKGIQSKVGSLHGNIKAMGHSVVGWLEQALKITHKPMSWLRPLEWMVSKESSGSPTAHNASGASGLLQTKPATFAEYSLGGSIWNPVANAVAAIRYLSANYGSPFNIPGIYSNSYVGYWKGGWINEPVLGKGLHSGATYGFAEHGPEYVNPGGSGGGDTVVINCHPSNNPDEVAAVVWKQLRDLKRHRGGGALGLA